MTYPAAALRICLIVAAFGAILYFLPADDDTEIANTDLRNDTTAAASANSVATGQAAGITPGELPYDDGAMISQEKIAAVDAAVLNKSDSALGKADLKVKRNAPSNTIALAQGHHQSGKNGSSHIAQGVRTKNRHLGKPYSMRKKAERSLAAVARSKRVELQQCEKAGNFIMRERCKWKTCNGMWGEFGCPSYKQQAALP